MREGRAAVGRKLLDVPGYTYRVFVTSREEAAELIWRDYNQRATLEQRIDELKSDLGADAFCWREFYATEAAFRSVLLLFNLLALWQAAARPGQTYRRPRACAPSLPLRCHRRQQWANPHPSPQPFLGRSRTAHPTAP